MGVSEFTRNEIIKYYKNGEFVLNDMPLFRSCNDISLYLKHYKSYISGEDFSDEPLWLFNSIDDPKYEQSNYKYIKLENYKFDRPRFFNYITSYQFIEFRNGLHHWKKLNNQQKYLVWCAITGIHPEIRLSKKLICEDLAVLLSEIYWHYTQSFSRYYLGIYCIDTCDLMNAKCIAFQEIKNEMEHFIGTQFLEGYMNTFDKETYHDNYFFDAFWRPNGVNETLIFKYNLRDTVKNGGLANLKSFKKLNSTKIIDSEISLLNDIIKEINEFTITKTNNLKTSNLNYINHMSINYPSSKEINSCAQQ